MGGVVGSIAAGAISVGVGFVVGGPIGAGLALAAFGLSFAASQLQGGKKKTTQQLTFEDRSRDRFTTIRSATAARRIVVGETSIGGVLFYGTSTGPSNKFAHVVIGFCDGSSDGGDVEGVPYVYFDDERVDTSALDADGNVTVGRFANRVRIRLHLGAENQLADQDLIDALAGTASEGEWTADHRLQGIVYGYFRFEYDEDVFETGSLPDVRAIVRGERAIENLRTGTPGWSRNPSEIVRWYLKEPRIGLKSPDYYLDDARFLAAANVCEEQVALLKGGTQDRYTCDGVIEYGKEEPVEILEDLLTSMAAALTFSEMLYGPYPGEYRPPDPAVAIDEDAAIADVDWTRLRERREIVNRVRCKAIDPTRDFALSESFEYRDPDAEAADGKPLSREIELPFTQDYETGSHRQQRLCKLHLNKARKGVLMFPGNMRLRGVAVAEPVQVTIAKLNMLDKVFLPVSYDLDPRSAGGIQLELQPEDPSDYAWDPSDAYDVEAPPSLNPPDNPPAVVQDFNAQQSGLDNVTATWTEVDPRPFGYDLGYGPVGGAPANATFLTFKQRGTSVYTAEIPPGTWVLYLWAVDEYQKRSPNPASTQVVVQNFNEIVRDLHADPGWIGARVGWLKHWTGVLVPSSTKAAAELTNQELFESFAPYPVAESSITYVGTNEVDLGFDAAGVRVFGEVGVRLGPGVAEGNPIVRLDLDWRLSSGFYEGWSLSWSVGIIDFRYLIYRLVRDNSLGATVLETFRLVLDVQEAALRDQAATVPPGGGYVAFAQPFHTPPSVFVQSVEPHAGAPAFVVWDPAQVTQHGFTPSVLIADGTDVGGSFVYSAVGALGRAV